MKIVSYYNNLKKEDNSNNNTLLKRSYNNTIPCNDTFSKNQNVTFTGKNITSGIQKLWSSLKIKAGQKFNYKRDWVDYYAAQDEVSAASHRIKFGLAEIESRKKMEEFMQNTGSSNEEAVRLLLENGANLNLRDTSGESFLHIANRGTDPEILSKLQNLYQN